MNRLSRTLRVAPLAASLILALLGAAAQAAPKPSKGIDSARMTYEREKADCMMGRTAEPRDVCLKEAGAAYALARQGRLVSPDDGPSQWSANALRRCQAQPLQDRELCESRVREGLVSGSVEGGGQLKTLTVRTTDTPKNPGN